MRLNAWLRGVLKLLRKNFFHRTHHRIGMGEEKKAKPKPLKSNVMMIKPNVVLSPRKNKKKKAYRDQSHSAGGNDTWLKPIREPAAKGENKAITTGWRLKRGQHSEDLNLLCIAGKGLK